MSDAPVAAKGWWEGMKPVNFQWTVLRCDIQVAQELNRGGGKGHSGPTSGPITNFQAARKRHCPQNARRGGSSFKIKKGKTLRGTDARATWCASHRIRIAAPLAEETL